MTILTKAEIMRRVEERLTPEAREQQKVIHEALGGYMALWANVESLLIGVLGQLLSTTEANAHVVYTALPTVHARRRTIVALARQNLAPDDAEKIVSLMKRFKTETSERNSLAHAEYMIDGEGFYTATAHYDLDRLDAGKPLVEEVPWDQKRLDAIGESRRRLFALADELSAICHAWKAQREERQA